MDSWSELEDRTLWDITVNGSPIELLWVAIACFLLTIMYSVIGVYSWVKFRVKRQ